MTIGTFGTFEAPAKVNRFAETVKQFALAADENPDVSWTVELDAAKEIVDRNLIAEAANAIGKTARLRSRDDSKRTQVGTREKSGNAIYEGKVSLTFTLAPQHAQRRGKEETPAETPKTSKK